MKFRVTYMDDKDVLTVDFDGDTGQILVDGAKPREVIEFRLVGLALRLQDMYELLKKENGS